jgi:putative DNA methylase
MSDLAKRLGRRIYEFRKQNRLTQAALAEKARISNEFMSAVERGAKMPSLPVLEGIAGALNLQHAQEMLNKAQVDGDPAFFAALEAVLEVLPVSKAFSGIDLEGDVAEFGSDFEALENLRKLAFAADVDEPQQLQLWKEEAEALEAKQ